MYLPIKKPLSPYVGFIEHGKQLELADGACHCLLSGPTDVGKTTVLASSVTMWGGPAVVVSSKDDAMERVCERRWGPKLILDLRPDYSTVYPAGIPLRSFDPVALIHTPDQAVTMATTMMQMSAVGMGSTIDQVSDGGIWEANSEMPLAAMLFTASSRGNRLGIEWVLHAVDNMAKPKPREEGKPPPPPLGPGWWMAAHADVIVKIPLFRNALLRTLAMDPRQRDSIALTMRKAVSPWGRLGLREGLREGPKDPAFDDSFLDDPDATLFVLASPEGSIAGAAVTLLEHLVRVWRAKTARKEPMYRLLLALDEACNICPMPGLRRHVSEGRGLGCNLLVSVQSSRQFDTIYGTNYANELRGTFPSALIMYGADEMEMLQRGEIWSRETTRRQSSTDSTGNRTLSPVLGSSLDYRRLLPMSREKARLLRRGQPGIETTLFDWPEFVAEYDRGVKEFLRTSNGRPVSDPINLWEWIGARHKRALKASRS